MSYCRCPDVTFTLKKDFSRSWSSSRFSYYNAMNYWSFLPFTQVSIQCWRLGVWASRPHLRYKVIKNHVRKVCHADRCERNASPPPVRRLLKCEGCRVFGKRRNYASIDIRQFLVAELTLPVDFYREWRSVRRFPFASIEFEDPGTLADLGKSPTYFLKLFLCQFWLLFLVLFHNNLI